MLTKTTASEEAGYNRQLSFPFLVASYDRAAELHFGKTEAVAQLVGGLRQALQLFVAGGVEQIELFASVRE